MKTIKYEFGFICIGKKYIYCYEFGYNNKCILIQKELKSESVYK